MTPLLLLLLIIALIASFFSMQKKMNFLLQETDPDRLHRQPLPTNEACSATTCAGYTTSNEIYVVYHSKQSHSGTDNETKKDTSNSSWVFVSTGGAICR